MPIRNKKTAPKNDNRFPMSQNTGANCQNLALILPLRETIVHVTRNGKQQELTKMKEAVIYVRVSTQRQADHGVSLEAQEQKARQWCEYNGYKEKSVHVDAGIGGREMKNRPALNLAMSELSEGDALVFYSLSRVARSTRDALLISEHIENIGADMVSTSEKIDTTTAVGKMVYRMLAVMAEFESDLIKERTQLAMQLKKSQGAFLGGKCAPYGYTKSADGKMLEPLESEQEVVRLVKKYRSEGMKLRRISSELERAGILSRTSKPFDAKQISRIAQSN